MTENPPEALLDTNVVIRVVMFDGGATLVAAALEMMRAAGEGRLRLVLKPVVVAEALFVLESHYGLERQPAADAVQGILLRPGISCGEQTEIFRSLAVWKERPGLHFVDCYLIAAAEAGGAAVATLDRGIARSGLVPIVDGST